MSPKAVHARVVRHSGVSQHGVEGVEETPVLRAVTQHVQNDVAMVREWEVVVEVTQVDVR